MRSWTGRIVAFAEVVITVVECSHSPSSPAAGSRQAVHRPATASGSPSALSKYIGCLAGLPFAVSGPSGVPAFHS